MPTITDPKVLADALEDADNVILRWGHGQMRQLPAAELEMVTAALRASAPPEAPRREIVAWRAHTDNGKQHLIWRSEGDEDWLRKHYVRWDALFAEFLKLPWASYEMKTDMVNDYLDKNAGATNERFIVSPLRQKP